jgi:chromosome segregation ATPase
MEIEKKKAAKGALKQEPKGDLKEELKDELKEELKADSQKQPAGRSWDHIESDLKEALNTWSDLTEELADKMSPEEAQLQEIKSLLGTLRDKLKEFSDEAPEAFTAQPPLTTKSQLTEKTESAEPSKKHSPPSPQTKPAK